MATTSHCFLRRRKRWRFPLPRLSSVTIMGSGGECVRCCTTRCKMAADHCRNPAPPYHIGQTVWLSTCDLPLKIESSKLAPRFVCSFHISRDVLSRLTLLSFLFVQIFIFSYSQTTVLALIYPLVLEINSHFACYSDITRGFEY